MKRFCPGCAQRTLQMNAAPCDICGRVNEITPPQARSKPHFFARILRALLAPLGRFIHILTFVFVLLSLWSMALHGILPFLGWVSLGLAGSGLLVVGLWSLRLIARGAVWVFAPQTRSTPRPGARGFLILPLCLALLWVLNRFEVPLRVAFRLSQPGLRKMPFVGTPNRSRNLMMNLNPVRRVGLYKATRVDANGPNVRVKVTDRNFLWSGTSAGFAYCPQGGATVRFLPVYMRSDPIRYIQLSRDWFWWEESGTDD